MILGRRLVVSSRSIVLFRTRQPAPQALPTPVAPLMPLYQGDAHARHVADEFAGVAAADRWR